MPVRVLVIAAITVAIGVAAACTGWRFRYLMLGAQVNDVLVVRVHHRNGKVWMHMPVKVIALKPGELVLAGQRRVRINNEVWTVSLSGVLPRRCVLPNDYVESGAIRDFEISKTVRYDDDEPVEGLPGSNSNDSSDSTETS